MTAPYTIETYVGQDDRQIAEMVLEIQNQEQGLGLTIDDQPDLKDIVNAYRGGGFWIARKNGEIIGTLGLLRYGTEQAVLKKFFIKKQHRGSLGPAKALFDALISRAHSAGIKEIFLDTPSSATRSHTFYLKHGFERIDRTELPSGYKFPDRDSLIFRLKIH